MYIKKLIKSKTLYVLLCLFFANKTDGQNIAINTDGSAPDASAMLDIVSTNKGLLIPRVALTGTSDVTTIASAATSLLVYNTATVSDVTPGYYYWTGLIWARLIIANPSSANWDLLGNATTVANTNFIGTTDNIDLTFRTNNIERMRIKAQTLEFLNNGSSVYLGEGAGAGRTTGASNVALGYQSLFTLSTASQNVAVGYQAAYNCNANNNVAIGYRSMYSNSAGTSNVAVGNHAMYSYTSVGALAIGDSAMYTNASGANNVAIGIGALRDGAGPSNNVAIGRNALKVSNAADNIAIGYYAGRSINTGTRNVAIGINALALNSTSSDNVAIGYQAGYTANSGTNVFVGSGAGYSNAGSGNVFIGYQAGYNEAGSNKLYIDNSNTATPLIYGDFSSNRVGINRVPTALTFEVGGEASKATSGAWALNSDRRIKTDIQDIDNAIETIMKLRPVKFKYSNEWKNRVDYIKENDHYYYNFIAQEYKEVFPDFVKGSGEYLKGDSVEILQIDTYAAQIVAIKAIQEQQKLLEQQKLILKNQKKAIEQQNSDIENQQAKIEAINQSIIELKKQVEK